MKPSAINGASEEIRAKVLQMGREGQTHEQIVEWLSDNGISSTSDTVGYHLRNNGIHVDRQWWINPANTFDGRMKQYVTAIIAHESPMFRLFDLCLKGKAWGACTRALLKKGMIKEMQCSGRWYEITGTKEEFTAMICDTCSESESLIYDWIT